MTPPRTKSIPVVPAVRLYVRQSEDETKQSSTENQHPLIDRCVAELRKRGVITDEMSVVSYQDIGGARYDFTRPDFLKLMGDVSKGDIVVIAWRERLGSGARYVVAIEDIVKVRGARLFIADPVIEEIIWDKTRGLVESIHGSQSDAFIEDLKNKTTKALRRRLSEGYAANDVGFGYRTEPDPSRRKVTGGVERFEKKIFIDEAEAALVVRIFEMRAQPMGWAKIAKTLNREGLRSYLGNAWSASTIHDIVRNRKFICDWSMGKRKAVKSGGQRRVEAGDDPVLIRVPEHLRIISQELWDRANAKRGKDLRMNEGNPVHALTGVLRCAECAGSMSILGSKGRHYYACSRHRRSGACAVKATIRADRLESAILNAAADILVAVEAAIRDAFTHGAKRRANEKQVDVSEVEVELQAAQERLRKARAHAFKTEDYSEETVAHLKRLDERAKQLMADKAKASSPADAFTAELIEREALDRIADMRRALAEHPKRARESMHRLFPRGMSLRVTPDTYEIEGVPDETAGCTPQRIPSGLRGGVQTLRLSIPRRRAA